MAEVRNIDTRERILDAAERLFMAHGYEGTSMRQITGEAAVNLAAANYHFGSKESLMQEVFRRRLDWLNEERLRVLDAMEGAAAGKPLKPSQIVDGFFGTLLRLADDDQRGGIVFLRLLGRTHTEPSEFIRAFLADEYAGVMERYQQALFRALPDVPRAEIVWRFHFMLGATSYAIAGTDALRLVADWKIEEADMVDRNDRLVPRLMSFLLGGLRAPLPQFKAAGEAGSRAA
ncbi:MAG: TetR family transcriptional regulator [Dechloromonas sp.]|uniref:TetR family transcriptional regulator n=1 Tax=Candidatus Dechloromonas phosphorivorans TaxID=2899244 RepID=A0A9D7QM44_9RHOO|nr:TetR family transcriptional regulator [Candidatus Dechloromonas phosphorivorans]